MNDTNKRPVDRASWDQRYVEGELPWDTGKPDIHLPGVVEGRELEPGKALEIGCGTGTNTIWLARQGFEVTGLDLSDTAIAMARSKAADASVDARFVAADFLADEIPGGPFDFVYDRGCFHTFREPDARTRFATRVGELLGPEGLWHSLIGSTDGPPRDYGPPRHSAHEIIAAVEPHFEILELRSTHFDREHHAEARAWVLVARRRLDPRKR